MTLSSGVRCTNSNSNPVHEIVRHVTLRAPGCARVELDARSRLPLDSMRFRMMFEPENACATAVRPGIATLVEGPEKVLLLDLGRGCEPWGLPVGRPPEPFQNPRALW
jgi:hypothetical protein